MANQHVRFDISEFTLDLHGTEVHVAKLIVRKRLLECYRYGIRVLKVIYGTPDDFDHSIAKVVHQIIRCNEWVALEMLPSYVLSDAQPRDLNPALSIYLRQNPHPEIVTDNTRFEKFTPKFEKDIARRLRCETPYMPLRRSFPMDWVARAIGCSRTEIETIAASPALAAQLDGFDSFPWAAVCSAAQQYREFRMGSKHLAIPSPASDKLSCQPKRPLLVHDTGEQAFGREIEAAKQLTLESRYEEAEEKLLALLSNVNVQPPEIRSALLELGRVYLALNKPEAEGILRRCMDVSIRDLGLGRHLIAILEPLAIFYLKTGDYDSYFKLLEDNANLQTDSPVEDRLPNILSHALCEFAAGRHADSLRRLEYFSHVKGDARISKSLDAERYCLIGRNYAVRYNLFLADLAFRCGLDCCASGVADEDIRLRILIGQGMVQRRSEHFQDASHTYEEAMRLSKRIGLEDTIVFADLQVSIGVVERHIGNFEVSEKCYRKATDIYTKHGRIDTPEYGKLLISLAALRLAQRRVAEAGPLLCQAKDLYDLKCSHDADSAVCVRQHLATLYSLKGDHELYQVQLEEVVSMAEQRLGPMSMRTAAAKNELADCLLRLGNQTDAEKLYRGALEAIEHLEGANSPRASSLRKKLEILAGRSSDEQDNSLSPRVGNCGYPTTPSLDTVEDPATSELQLAVQEFASLHPSGRLGRAFALAARGNIQGSLEEFEEAEEEGDIGARAYHNYGMVMFLHGYTSRAYYCARQVRTLDPEMPLNCALREIMRDWIGSIDQHGNLLGERIATFGRLRNEYFRSRQTLGSREVQ